ncbi:MAG: tetratricopeptide repeat protein [Butyricicoccaceae bacterium]
MKRKELDSRAAAGDAEAMYELGWRYRDGRELPKDYVRAAGWLRRAAEQGHAKAMCSLGVCYEYGMGVPRDPAEADAWYLRAAQAGDADAQLRFAEIAVEQRDREQAMYWLTRYVDSGGDGWQDWYVQELLEELDSPAEAEKQTDKRQTNRAVL